MNTTARKFVAASDLRVGDRLYKHGVTIASVAVENGTALVTFAHRDPGYQSAFAATQKFHIIRQVAA